MNICLIGMMGSGKTTVGKILALKTGKIFVDTDEKIEEEQEMKISEIFRELGEKAFRRMEKQFLEKIPETDELVISAGGGLAADEENLRRLKETGKVIWLYACPEETLRRIRGAGERPLLNVKDPVKEIEALLGKREKFYSSADIKIDTTGLTPDQVADRITALLGG